MPFKKDKNKKPAYPVQPSYPVQASYPTQPSYPPYQGAFQPTVVPQGAYMSGYPQQYQAGAMPPPGPPPPYTPQAQAYPAPPMPMGPAPVQYTQPGASTVLVQGGFDAGARNPTSVPPPPPGYTANAAQAAVNQGQNVVLTQRSSNWMTGGSDGGYVVW